MEEYNIIVTGITNPLNIPKKYQSITNKTLYKKHMLNCTDKLINIKKILSINIRLDINNGFKNKNTVFIMGYEKVSIAYMENTINKDINKLNYKFPFFGEVQYPINDFKLNQVYAAVTKLKYKLTDSNNIVLENWIYLAPLIIKLDSNINNNIKANSNLGNTGLARSEDIDITIDYDMNLDN